MIPFCKYVCVISDFKRRVILPKQTYWAITDVEARDGAAHLTVDSAMAKNYPAQSVSSLIDSVGP